MYTLLVRLLQKYYRRARFGKWCELEDIRLRDKSADEVSKQVNRYLSSALSLPESIIEKLDWITALLLYYKLLHENAPQNSELPLLAISKTQEKNEKVSWDYPGRTRAYYIHLLAQAYGWTIDKIEQLETETALALIQEVLTDEQLRREFEWSMSENAYSYNPTTKTSKFRPLSRPYWMLAVVKEIPTFKIKREFMPYGVVNDTGGMEKEIQSKILTSKVEENDPSRHGEAVSSDEETP